MVVRGHFCLSKSLVSRGISEVSSLFHSIPGRSAAGYFFLRSYRSRVRAEGGLRVGRAFIEIIVHFIEPGRVMSRHGAAHDEAGRGRLAALARGARIKGPRDGTPPVAAITATGWRMIELVGGVLIVLGSFTRATC